MEDIVESLQGKTMLLAYWYKHDLERIRERLEKIGVSYQQMTYCQTLEYVI